MCFENSQPDKRKAKMTDETYENIKIEREGEVTFLVLNRPEKRNAMSPGLHYDVENALQRLEDDPQTKVLVLTGAGDAWCAGQTSSFISARLRTTPPNASVRTPRAITGVMKSDALFQADESHGERLLFGGAFTQLCACDFAIAAEDAIFGLSEVNWASSPAAS